MALSKQDINLEDAIDIREVRKQKLDVIKLNARRNKRLTNSNRCRCSRHSEQMQSQQMAAQAAQQKRQLESQAKMQLEQTKTDMSIQRLDAEAKYSTLVEREFEMNMQLQGMTQEQPSSVRI